MKPFLIIAVIIMTIPLIAATNIVESVSTPATNAVLKTSAKQERPQCEATTLSGNRCKRRATHDSHYCSQHAAIIRKRENDKKENDAQQGGKSYTNAVERQSQQK